MDKIPGKCLGLNYRIIQSKLRFLKNSVSRTFIFKCSFEKFLKVILSFFLQMLYTSFIANEPEVSDLSGQDKARTEVITVHNDI